MKINHIAMYVNNLERTKEFYEKYFNATSNEKYHNVKTDLESYFLTFEDNSRLEIMTRPEIVESKKFMYNSGYSHIAISVGSRENVDKLTRLLKEDGFRVLSMPRVTGDGYYESLILDYENNQIEIVE
jgi:lactoylglutathione lyase